MTVAFTGDVRLTVSGNYTSNVAIGSVSHTLGYVQNLLIANGTGAGQADQVFANTYTVTSSGTQVLNLTSTILDAFGNALTFATIKGIIVAASATNTNNVLVGAGTDPVINYLAGTTPQIVVRPGGFLCLMTADATGYAVTTSTADRLTLTNSAGSTSVTFDVILIGNQ